MVRPDGPAETFLNRYAEFAADPAPSGLRHHYVAYRAVVRAKVALLRHDQGEPHAAADATAHLELALRHLRDGAVRLALVGGLPATGKTTLGERSPTDSALDYSRPTGCVDRRVRGGGAGAAVGGRRC